jgi:hypothetical protein
MRYQEDGDPRPPRVPALGEMWDRFPGPVAIPAGQVGGSAPQAGFAANDDDPWSIDLDYSASGEHLLTVRTVRSRDGLDPYGLPVEDLAGAIIDFENRGGATPSPRPSSQDPEAWVEQHIAASRLSRAEVARTPTVATSMRIDGIETPGIRVDVSGRAAVQLAWGPQTVFCAGRPEIVDALTLRSAVPEDFAAAPPR